MSAGCAYCVGGCTACAPKPEPPPAPAPEPERRRPRRPPAALRVYLKHPDQRKILRGLVKLEDGDTLQIRDHRGRVVGVVTAEVTPERHEFVLVLAVDEKLSFDAGLPRPEVST